MTIADLAALTEHVKISALCRAAGVSSNMIQRRVTRYRRGEPYPELTEQERDALIGAIRRLRDELEQAIR